MTTKYVLNENVNNDGAVVGSPQEFECEGEANLEVEIAENQTDKIVTWSVDVSQILCIIIEASEDMKLETNADDATGGNTIDLLGGVPYVWHENSYYTNELVEDVALLYMTNTTAGTLKIQCGLDSTPE
jgi:hypothetical protein